MKAMRATVLFLLLLFIADDAFSQELDSYVIITYERKTTPNQHGTQVYYRIAKTDSLQNSEQDLAPLYFEGFATQALRTCCSDSTSEIFSLRESSTFSFDADYMKMMEELKNIVLRNRMRVQIIRKSWSDYREDVIVYATPVTGKMCACVMTGYDALISKYEGVFYMPLSNFSLDKELWADKKLFYKTVSRDYSRTQVSTGF